MTPRRNVELKATDPDPDRTLATCRTLGAEDRGVIEQRDTYFAAPSGRLKLREQRPGVDELISYVREDRAEQRLSSYRVVVVDDAAGLAGALGDAIGILGVVSKRRRLLLHDGVRIHLDEVQGLGAFVELEAVAPRESDLQREHAAVTELRAALDITDDRLCPQGYATLFGITGPYC